MSKFRFRKATPLSGNSVTQDFDICFPAPRIGKMDNLATTIENLFNQTLRLMKNPPIKCPKFNDIAIQRYKPGSLGISPHKDHKKYISVIIIITLSGKSDLCICEDRKGLNQFQEAISNREKNGINSETTFIGINSAEIKNNEQKDNVTQMQSLMQVKRVGASTFVNVTPPIGLSSWDKKTEGTDYVTYKTSFSTSSLLSLDHGLNELQVIITVNAESKTETLGTIGYDACVDSNTMCLTLTWGDGLPSDDGQDPDLHSYYFPINRPLK